MYRCLLMLVTILSFVATSWAQMSPEEAMRLLREKENKSAPANSDNRSDNEEEEEEEEDAPDLSQYDADTLRTLAAQLYEKIRELESRVNTLEQQLTSEPNDDSEDDVLQSINLDQKDQFAVVIRIVSNQPPDLEHTQQQMAAEQARERELAQKLQKLKNELVVKSAEKEIRIEGYYDANGKSRTRQVTRKKYSNTDLQPLRTQIAKLESERLVALRNSKRAEEQIRQASISRTLTGTTPTGQTVTIIAAGPHFTTGTRLIEGKSYLVRGITRTVLNNMRILLRAAEPVETGEEPVTDNENLFLP